MQVLSTSFPSGSVESNNASFVSFLRSHGAAQHVLTLREFPSVEEQDKWLSKNVRVGDAAREELSRADHPVLDFTDGGSQRCSAS